MRLEAAALSGLALLGLNAAWADETGRDIFLGKVDLPARVAGVDTSATRFACSSCHQRDGLGGDDGGVSAPPILWRILSSASDRRPAYDLETFGRLLREGRDSGGRAVASAMPAYALDAGRAETLARYLDRLEGEQLGGIGAEEVRVAVLYSAGRRQAADRVVAAVNQAVARLGDPAVYGRRLVAVTLERSASDDGSVAAFVMPVESLADAGDEPGIPVLAPIKGLVGDEDAREVRGLFASASQQWSSLLEHAPRDAPVIQGSSPDGTRRLVRRIRPLKERSLLALSDFLAGSGTAALAPEGLDALPLPTAMPRKSLTVFSTVDGSAASLEDWRRLGATVILADPRPQAAGGARRGDLERLADAAVRTLLQAMDLAGPDATRTRLMRAVGQVELRLADWPAINFSVTPLTGSREVRLLSFGPRDP